MTESKHISAITNLLLMLEGRGKLCFVRNNSGAFKTEKGFYRFGRPGSPDFIVGVKGMAVGFEVKAGEYKQSKDQIEFQVKWIRAGNGYYVVHGVDEVHNILKAFYLNK